MIADFTEHSSNVRRDTARTVLLGPLRLLLMTGGALLLLRVVFARFGLEVVGLWSLLNLAAAIVPLADIGFSLLLAREMHVSDPRDETLEHMLDKRAVERFCQWMFAPVLLLAWSAAWLWPSIPYDRARFMASVALVVWSAVVQLQGKLEAAVLAAYQDNARVQVAHALGAVLVLATAICGACVRLPLEGASLGSLFSALWIFRSLRRRAATHLPPAWQAKLTVGEGIRRVRRMAGAGLHFYSLSLGALFREPCFRLIIAALLGTEALGAYTIGFRLSVTARDAVAGGFYALYPSMSSLHRAGKTTDVVSLQIASMIFLLVLGGIALGLLYGFAEPALCVLLGAAPELVVSAIRILAVWNLITLFNVPFDFLLQASGHERISAASLWLHTCAILLLWPIGLATNVDLRGLLIYWTISSLATQGIIFFHAQAKLNAFWPVVKTPQVMAIVLLTIGFWLIVPAWVSRVHAVPGSWGQAFELGQVIVPVASVFLGLAFVVSRRLFAPYWRPS